MLGEAQDIQVLPKNEISGSWQKEGLLILAD
jgi:hypothetical protein